jgi:hypothetical protein
MNMRTKKLPSLEKEGWQPLRLTGWFVSFLPIRDPKSAQAVRRSICEKSSAFSAL